MIMDSNFPPKNLKEAVYSALCFFDIFDYPLSLREIHHYLMKIEVSEKELFDFLEKENRIGYVHGYYFLEGRDAIVDIRFAKHKIALKYWAKVNFYLPFIQLIPYVKMVAVCNTLAFNNPTDDSDIDLFIVTAKGKIFLTRILVTVLFALLGVRRHGQKIAGRFCLSFFVSENGLDLKSIYTQRDDIYLLYWFMTLRPFYGEKTFQDFIAANRWVEDYFPYGFNVNKNVFKSGSRILALWRAVLEFVLNLSFANFIEKHLHKMQLKRHHHNQKNLGEKADVIINEKMLKFHNIDRRKEFAQKFQSSSSRFL